MSSSAELRRRRVGAFMQIADEERSAAETLLSSLPRRTAYFQQQCVEDVAAGATHNLRTLADLLPQEHKLKPAFLAFEELSSAATRYRYPSGSGDAPKMSAETVWERQGRFGLLRETVKTFLNANSSN